MSIKKITIRNFKNLKDFIIHPKKFNVIVGPNGSGKTNFIEAFKLFKKIYAEKNPYPFLEWGGYRNVVYNHNTGLPIELEIEAISEFKFKEHTFEIPSKFLSKIWADETENLIILEEVISLEIPEIDLKFLIEKKGKTVKLDINNEEIETESKKPEDIFQFCNEILPKIFSYSPFHEDQKLVEFFCKAIPKISAKLSEYIVQTKSKKDFEKAALEFFMNLLEVVLKQLSSFIEKSILLFSLDIVEIKSRKKVQLALKPLSDRGENVFDVLALEERRKGKLPDEIEYFIQTFFNGRMYLIADDFYFYDLNKNIEFSKEHLPDGLIKSLAILTGLEKEPTIFFIDEIENSLHPELLEYLITTIKEKCKGITFITTHSPIILNLAEPEEIWVFKPIDEGIIAKNLTEYKSKEEIQKELEELGLTLGEKVFYGLT